MKQFISTLAMVALMSSPAFAQKKKTQPKAAPAASAPAASAPVYSYNGGGSSSSGEMAFNAAVMLGSVNGAFTFGPALYLEWPVNMSGNDWAFGAQTGFMFFDGGWTIPIMGSAKFNFVTSGNIKPYAALSIGINIAHSNGVTILGTTVGGGSSTGFALLARPGMNFGEGGKFFAELPLGTMSSGFAILPTFGYHF